MASRQDILNNLPHKAGSTIARRLGTPQVRVSEVLHGHRRANTKYTRQVISIAQMMAAMSLWNRTYPLGELKLDPFKAVNEKLDIHDLSDEPDSEQRVLKLESDALKLKKRVTNLEVRLSKLI